MLETTTLGVDPAALKTANERLDADGARVCRGFAGCGAAPGAWPALDGTDATRLRVRGADLPAL